MNYAQKLALFSMALFAWLVSAPRLSAAEVHPEDLAVIEEILAVRAATLERLGQPVPALERAVPGKRGAAMEIFGTGGSKGVLRIFIEEESGRINKIFANGPWFPNDAFPILAKLPQLRALHGDHNIVMATRKTDASFDGSGLVHMADSPLEELTIGHGFDDAGMAAISHLKKLKSLRLVHAMGGSSESAKALTAHPSLEEIVFALGPEKTNDEVCLILATIPNLKVVGLHETHLRYAGGLEHLKPLAGTLKKVTFDASLMLPSDIDKLKADHPGLEVPEPNLSGLHRSRRRQKQMREAADAEALALLDQLLSEAPNK